MRRVCGKHLIRGPDQDVRVLGLEHEISIELFHDVIKARDGCAAFVARLDPDRVKERQLHDAIFRKEWGDLFAVWDYCETSSKSDFASFDLVRQCEDWRSRSLPRFIGSQKRGAEERPLVAQSGH
jgi:hypothetical protein